MRLEFDITLTAKDMFRFNLYQTYTGASGWISVIAAVVCFAAAVQNTVNAEHPIRFLVFCLER